MESAELAENETVCEIDGSLLWLRSGWKTFEETSELRPAIAYYTGQP